MSTRNADISLTKRDTYPSLFPQVSCMRVLTTQMGFVALPVTIPAKAAAERCTYAFSRPSLNVFAMICLPFPYVKKFMDRAGMTPTSVGPSPLKSADAPSYLWMSLQFRVFR